MILQMKIKNVLYEGEEEQLIVNQFKFRNIIVNNIVVNAPTCFISMEGVDYDIILDSGSTILCI